MDYFEAWLLPIGILCFALVCGFIVNKIIDYQIRRHIDEADSFKTVFIKALRGTPVALCMGIGLYWSLNTLEIHPALAKFFSYILFSLIVISITRTIASTFSGMIDLQAQKGDRKVPRTSLLNNVISVVIYAMGALIILDYCGISIAPVITALGVGGMAMALGLQDTLANVFSGMHLILNKQINLDDYIRLSSGEEGKVADITWRYTTIATIGGSTVIVPNQKIATAILTNYSIPRQEISITIPVSVSYDSDLEKVERVTLDVAKKVMEQVDHKIEKDPIVRFSLFNESSIDLSVILHSANFTSQFPLKHEFIKALTSRYREENITMPYPIRTIIDATPVSGDEAHNDHKI